MQEKEPLDKQTAREGDLVMFPVDLELGILEFGRVVRVCQKEIGIRVNDDFGHRRINFIPRGNVRVILSAQE